jgi:hypothetical protein
LPPASTFSLLLADKNYEDLMSSQKEPAQVVPAIEYTVESANWLIAELRAIPAKDPAKRKLDKQGMVSLLVGELIALQQRATEGDEARGVERACARDRSDPTRREAGGDHAGDGRGAGGHRATERQGSVSREGQGQLLKKG